MPSSIFHFRFFTVNQSGAGMKVGTDAILLGAWANPGNAANILDIGAGTGVLALMMAQKSKDAPIDAIEVDENAADCAASNFANSRWANRLKLFRVPVQEFTSTGKYDFIISNPPYFDLPQREIHADAIEPSRKTARINYQLSFEELVKSVSGLISESGKFYVILPYDAREKFIALCKAEKMVLIDDVSIRSFAGNPPVRCILGFSKTTFPVSESEIVIYEKPGVRTAQYIELTKDFHAVTLR